MNRGGIGNLPFLRTSLAILQKYQEQSSWEVIDSFFLVAYAVWQLQQPFCSDY